MAQENINVITLNTAQTSRKDNVPVRNAVLLECRTLFNGRFEPILSHFLEKIDDELFSLSDKAINSTLQSLYFGAMRYIRKQRDDIKTSYVDSITSQYDAFCQNKIPRSMVGIQKELDQDSFELVENEALEEDLAITTMTAKGNNRFHRSLYDLNMRFAVLVGRREIDNEENPIAPARICQAFEKILKPLTLDLDVKLVVYKLFDTLVLSQLDTIYNELNTTLVTRGVLPVISRRVNHTGSPATTMGSIEGRPVNQTSIPSDNIPGVPPAQPIDLASLGAFQAMQTLLSNWRSHLSSSPSVNANTDGLNSGPAYQTNEVLHALSQLQITAPKYTPTGDTTPGNFKVYVADELKKRFSSDETRSIAGMEEDIIDMVAMIFDYILDDHNLPDPVKALIGRLQIPIVKTVILDKSFFAKKNHPARQLLNSLAKAGIELDAESCNRSPIFAEIERTVNRVLSEFNQDVDLFSELLEEFSAFLEKDAQRTQIVEKRTRQVTESKERLQLAKNRIAREIARRLQGKEIPVVVRNFLENAWKDVLVLTYLRKDKEPDEWGKALFIVDQLLWTTVPPMDMAEKNRKQQTIPGLLDDIQTGLESISYDPHQMNQIFKNLEACHATSLNKVGEVSASSVSMDNELCHANERELPSDQSVAAVSNRRIKDPELEVQISRLAENLPDIDDDGSLITVQDADSGAILQKNQLAENMSQQSTADEIPVETQQELEDAHLEKAKAMNVGQWIELTDEKPNKVRVKLSWKSQVTSLYVFVNRQGIKVAEKSLHQLAAQLRQGTVTIIENPDTPVMDRALAALMKTLRKPNQGEPVPA